MKTIDFIISSFFYEFWRIKQLFSNNSYGIYVILPNVVGFIQIKPTESSEEVYYSSLIFKKAYEKKEIFLNNNKGILKINWINLNIEAVFDKEIPQNEWKNFDLDF